MTEIIDETVPSKFQKYTDFLSKHLFDYNSSAVNYGYRSGCPCREGWSAATGYWDENEQQSRVCIDKELHFCEACLEDNFPAL